MTLVWMGLFRPVGPTNDTFKMYIDFVLAGWGHPQVGRTLQIHRVHPLVSVRDSGHDGLRVGGEPPLTHLQHRHFNRQAVRQSVPEVYPPSVSRDGLGEISAPWRWESPPAGSLPSIDVPGHLPVFRLISTVHGGQAAVNKAAVAGGRHPCLDRWLTRRQQGVGALARNEVRTLAVSVRRVC